MSLLRNHSKRSLVPRLAIVIALGLALIQPFVAESDDTFLFRVQSGKPYVYVIFDTSSSMNLSNDLRASKNDPPVWLETGADDPRSSFYVARSAVAEVFDRAFKQNGDFIHFGFMGYNQNALRLQGKHWMYSASGLTGVAIEGSIYPAAGEGLTFGAHLPVDATPDVDALPIPSVGQLGSCQDPVDFDTYRAAVNRFPKLHPIDNDADGFIDDLGSTVLWLTSGGTDYRLTVSKNAAAAGTLLNASPLLVDFKLDTMGPGCSVEATETAAVAFSLVRQFFLHDIVDDVDFGIKKNEEEFDGGIWLHQDATAVAQCGEDPHPHTGHGWEGNYDGNGATQWNPTTGFPDDDPFFCDPSSGFCDTLKWPTILETNAAYPSPEIRTLDRGDQLPYHWERTHREMFMRRLAANYSSGMAVSDFDFRVAPYFKDVPNANGFLELKNPNRIPMVPFGGSALAEALTDWRCFYLGTDEGGNKCKTESQPFGRGFDWLAPQFDLEWGCRRPRILVITDGENQLPRQRSFGRHGQPEAQRRRGLDHQHRADQQQAADPGSQYRRHLRRGGQSQRAGHRARELRRRHPRGDQGFCFGGRADGPGRRGRQDLRLQLQAAQQRAGLAGRHPGLPEAGAARR